MNITYIMNYIETFTSIYEKGSWGDDKHPVYKGSSGSGSEIDYNTDYIRCIRQFIKEKNIKTVVDLGCGTGKYYNIIYADLDIKYTGYDAYEKLYYIISLYLIRLNIHLFIKILSIIRSPLNRLTYI